MQWVDSYKAKYGCFRCHIRDFVVLEFHHRDPSLKKASVAKMVARLEPVAIIQAEIAKCEVVCANCHKRIHYDRRVNTKGTPLPLLPPDHRLLRNPFAPDEES